MIIFYSQTECADLTNLPMIFIKYNGALHALLGSFRIVDGGDGGSWKHLGQMSPLYSCHIFRMSFKNIQSL